MRDINLLDLSNDELERELKRRHSKDHYGCSAAEPDRSYDVKLDRIRDLRIACSLLLQTSEILTTSQTKSPNLDLAILKIKEGYMWISTEVNSNDGI